MVWEEEEIDELIRAKEEANINGKRLNTEPFQRKFNKTPQQIQNKLYKLQKQGRVKVKKKTE